MWPRLVLEIKFILKNRDLYSSCHYPIKDYGKCGKLRNVLGSLALE